MLKILLYARRLYPEIFDPRNGIVSMTVIRRLQLYDHTEKWLKHRSLKRRKRRDAIVCARLNACRDIGISISYAEKLEARFK
jgi:hypothetical protein